MSGDEEDLVVRRSSRSRGNKSTESRRSALEQFAQARRAGRTHKAEDDTVANVYEEVSEDEYQEIVKGRQQDCFVVDDDGGGYVDHGADFDDDEDDAREKRRKERKEKENKPKKGGIASFFSANNSMVKAKAKDDNDIKLEDDDDLADLLNEADAVETPSRNPFRHKPASAAAPPSPDREPITPRVVARQRLAKPLSAASSTRPPAFAAAAAAAAATSSSSGPTKRPAAVSVSPLAPPRAEKRAREEPQEQETYADDNDDFGMDFDDDFEQTPVVVEEKAVKKEPAPSSPAPRPAKVAARAEVKKEEEPEPMLIDDWMEEKKDSSSLSAAVPPPVAVPQGAEAFYVEKEGKRSLRVYWLDAFEDDKKHPGTVYLFGRVFTSGTASSSICLKVERIRKQIFVLPRQQEDGTPYPHTEVYAEMKELLMGQHGVEEIKCKKSTRKFINDGTVADPSEAVDVIEFQYYEPTKGGHTRLSPSHVGRTFTRVYNATTTSMERLLVECRLRGPGWINVANYKPAESKVSWCTYEFTVDMSADLAGLERPANIVYDSATMDAAPPVRMMCLNVVTALNAKKEPEILALSYLMNTAASIEAPTTDTKALRRMAFICEPPTGVALPFDLQRRLDERGLPADKVKIVKTEKNLLIAFLNSLSSEENGNEPDVYVGHDLQATIALLMAKCEKHKIVGLLWSRLSRLRRSTPAKQLGASKAAHWEVTAGRLMLDSRTSAMELVHSRQYDLGELCRTLLDKERTETAPHEVIGKYCGSSAGVIGLLTYSWMECYYPLCILAQLQAFPLFHRITNICGGVMSRTLLGGRAERNELLLLHAFHRAGLIAPDKYQHVFSGNNQAGAGGGAGGGKAAKGKGKKEPSTQQQSSQLEEGGADEGEEKGGEKAVGATNKGGAQYSGGLVLDPKKGLYDTLVLLLDFNSLYPSIIQQFNICFTTIRHEKNGDELPEEPKGVVDKGILPTEIENLVTQRYSVKKLMATERDPEKKKQFDIRQKALKLTANSMYGCLGFAQSRFYAKPLAALVTAKGREILMQTKTSVEKLSYEVIYGDTDSIMVNTGDLNMERAAKIAKEITKMVNERYKKIELEHEGTFRRMLLLKKKKYAALILQPGGKMKQELKGLDIVRRDWSMLAKKIGSDVVDVMLNPELSREELVEQVGNLLTTLKEQLDAGAVELDMFSIFKSLTRDPAKYENVQQQPHAAVARRMNSSGQKAYKQGDIVEYAICQDGTTASATARAYHKAEMKAREDLTIDFQYYLAQQVHPVVSRLTAPIEELDAVRIAELLGLDGSQYRHKASSGDNNGPAWQENFDHCEGIRITCPACTHVNEIREMFRGEGMNRRASLDCCEACEAPFHRASAAVYNQFSRQLSALVERQQQSPYVCEDVVCATRMRSLPMRVKHDGLECARCRTSFMHKEYTSKALFEQQTFFDRLLDLQTAVKAIKNNDQRTTIQYRPEYAKVESLSRVLRELNESFMAKNKYNIVDLAFLFGPMMSR